MKLSAFFPLLFTGLVVAKLPGEKKNVPQNTPCGNSATCSNRCSHGAFHIVSQPGREPYFGCRPIYKVKLLSVQCAEKARNPKGPQVKDEATRQACNVAGGMLCPGGKKSDNKLVCGVVDHDDHMSNFKTACPNFQTYYSTHRPYNDTMGFTEFMIEYNCAPDKPKDAAPPAGKGF